MPSFADSAVIFILALILFGPKKLPQLARQLGKLMAEFRRASNEFRMQMEDELRIEEQKEHQKKVDAMAGPPSTLPEPEHPHLPSTAVTESDTAADSGHAETAAAPAPIAESGTLRMMPPSTGLPVESGAYTTGRDLDFTYHDGDAPHEGNGNNDSSASNGHHALPEHSILPPAVGMSSEEPVEETQPATTHEAVHSA